MYHSYFYFRRLSGALSKILESARLMASFSQEKDELILQFYTQNETTFFLKADLSQGASILSFPQNFGRTRSNSVDLFEELTGVVVQELIQTPQDRSFHLRFANGLFLCFKMYGGRSNILFHNGLKVLRVFNHHLKKDLESKPPEGKEPDQSKVAFDHHFPDLKILFPTFDKWMWSFFEQNTFNLSPDRQWKFLQEMIRQMEAGPMYLCRVENEVILSFFRMGDVLEETVDPIEAANRYYYFFWQVNQFQKEKSRLVLALDQQIFHAGQQLEASEKQWFQAQEAVGFRQQADLLMAFGFQLEKGIEKAILPNFNTNEPVVIKLKKDLSIVENAERLYRKAKGQLADIERIESRIGLWKSKSEQLKTQLSNLKAIETRAGLKPFLTIDKAKTEDAESLPYHNTELLGFEIWIGKNARSNDEILRLAHKDDLWLHARDVAGSHVIIRNRQGRKVPQPVIERAAQLAAFFSKAKTESLAPVMVTERKYVRKNKSMAAGQVRVEREKTFLVPPVGL